MRHKIQNITDVAELSQAKKIIRGKTIYPSIIGPHYRCPQCRCLINVSGHENTCPRDRSRREASARLATIPPISEGYLDAYVDGIHIHISRVAI